MSTQLAAPMQRQQHLCRSDAQPAVVAQHTAAIISYVAPAMLLLLLLAACVFTVFVTL